MKQNQTKLWINEELGESKFNDRRLGKRFIKIVQKLSERLGSSIPTACQDWANIKAAYRFFSNQNLSEEQILEGHFLSTQARYEQTNGPILVLHDTTEITYKRAQPAEIGLTRKCANKNGLFNQDVQRAMCGVLMHSSLVITSEGLPLGLCANKFWNRDKFKGSKSLYRKKNATRIPIEEKESYRWVDSLKRSNNLLKEPERLVHIGDRESDMYEFFQAALSDNSNFLVRIKVDRRTSNETKTINSKMKEAKKKGVHTIRFKDKNGEEVITELQIKFEGITIKPPIGIKSKLYSDTKITVIFATEKTKPKNRARIEWKLATNLSIETLDEAIEKLQWYALRWRIETFFKILKSGCKVEESKLRTAEGLSKLISIFCILSWRTFWITMINREAEKMSVQIALTDTEIKILDYLKPDKKKRKKFLSDYIIKIAKLGGYIGRTADSPPGNKVIWRGLAKLSEIHLGVEIGSKLVGN